MATTADLPAAELFLSPRVMRRIEGSVTRLRRKFGLNHADGEDLQQDFYITILQARQLYDPEKCLLHRFVLMVINRRYKHHVRRLMHLRESIGNPRDAMGFDDVEPGLDLLIIDPVGENPLRRIEQRDAIEHALRDQPEFERRICELLMEGHTPLAISEHLKVAPSTVTRAMERIARVLAESDCFSGF